MDLTITSNDGLTPCDREPIHMPGSIQPHGMAIVAELAAFRVQHVAGDVEGRLGMSDWQNQPLDLLIGKALAWEISSPTEPTAVGGFIGQLRTTSGETLDVSAHRSSPYVIVELEAASTEGLPASRVVDRLAAAAGKFEDAATLPDLCAGAAIEFRRLTGFDRVMVYRFLPDAAGHVIAEDRRPDLHSFLHQRFPATDIPLQARNLYLRNLVRVIPEISYDPALLRPCWAARAPLDLSDSSLRSVSPIHLQYLRNMGVGASASFSIVKDGMLWGLIACHNEAPRFLTYDVRSAGRSLAASLARQIKAKEEAEGYRQRIRLRRFEDDIVALLSREGGIDETLSGHLGEMARMMGSDGVAVIRGADLVIAGVCPEEPDIRDLAVWLQERSSEPVFATDRLSNVYSPGSAFQALSSGLLSANLSTDDTWLILWFRAEQVETVNWAGNPHKSFSNDQEQGLTPRASFAAWAESVRGHARDWSLPEVEAAIRIRASLMTIQQHKRVRELNMQLTAILIDKNRLLEQKEFLIGEVNHRVQNSLQLISSYLAMQARETEDEDLQASLQEARRRLTAVSLVHRRLYRGDQIEYVDAARYIEELCTETLSFMGEGWSQRLSFNIEPVLVSTDRAVTLGLVLTELMINSNKHAYSGAPGPIEIELGQDGTHLRMTVSDKGVGKAVKRKGFGSRIMEGLVTQLGGELTYADNRPGLRVTVEVPLKGK